MVQRQTDTVVNTSAATVVTTAETLVAVSNPISSSAPPGSSPLQNVQARIRGEVVMTIGTNGVTLVLKIYRGATASGTLLGTVTLTATAAVVQQAIIDVLDVAPATYAQYCMTVTQGSASANGSVALAALRTDIISQ